jgi:hypothetical protein
MGAALQSPSSLMRLKRGIPQHSLFMTIKTPYSQFTTENEDISLDPSRRKNVFIGTKEESF